MKEIEKRYRKNLNEIKSNVNLLNTKLEKHNKKFEVNNTNWGYVGDLGYINEKLNEIVTFLKVEK